MPTVQATATRIDPDSALKLRRVNGALARRLRVSAAGGLTPSQLTCLATVCRHGPLRAGELATREALNPTSLSRIVARLEGLGHLTRRADPTDRRGALLTPTAAGKRTLAKVEAERTALLCQSLATLDPAAVAAIEAALPALELLVEALPAPCVPAARR